MLNNYGVDVQRLFLEMMMQDASSYVRVQNIYNPENFDRTLRPAAEFIMIHCNDHKTMPDRTQIKATTGIALQEIPDLNEGHFDWFLEEFEGFTRRQELERAILKSADLLEKGEYEPVEKLIKDAVQISLTKDLGTDFWATPKETLNKYFNKGGQVSTGWPQMDHILYGGFSRGELNIFAGGSGSGKSLVMMNMALNWLQQGLSGVYITLELSEELCTLRTAAMLTDMSTKDIRRDLDSTELKVKMAGKKSGSYRIKSLPAQSNVNDIRSFIKEYEIQTETKIDFVMIDYLDLIMPVSIKVNPNDQFIKDKYSAEELRNLAIELGVLMVTASQLNRSAVEEIEFDHSHIAGGISKINTADFVFGIFTSRAMKERGKYQMQCMKSRSSQGVGSKVDLDYNIETMRITDAGLDESGHAFGNGGPPKPNILDGIKTRSIIKSEEETPKVAADVQSNKLKQLLGQIKNNA